VSDTPTYKDLGEARMQDSTVYQMMRMNRPMSEIVVRLANEKAALLCELSRIKMTQPPPIMVLHPDGRVTPKLPTPHIPHIPPNIPQ
jgi:hypothetical protein